MDNQEETCHCKRCNRDLPKIDFFRKRKYWKLCNVCTEKKAASAKIWREEKGGNEKIKNMPSNSKERQRERQARYRAKNPNRGKEYYERERERALAKHKAYRANNKEKEKTRQKKWHTENKNRCECPHCEYTCSEKRKMVEHIARKHTEDKNIECPIDGCDFKCGHEIVLASHRRKCHNKQHKCDYDGCDYLAGNSTNLRVHVKSVHARSRDIQCPNCKFKTSTNGNLSKHQKRCTGKLHCSSGEFEIMKVLDKLGCVYDHDSSYEAKDKKYLQWDFIVYTDADPIFIEYDGKGHYHPVRFGGMSEEKAQEAMESCQQHDKIKNDYCDDNDLLLLRIPYWEKANIEHLVTSFLESLMTIKT